MAWQLAYAFASALAWSLTPWVVALLVIAVVEPLTAPRWAVIATGHHHAFFGRELGVHSYRWIAKLRAWWWTARHCSCRDPNGCVCEIAFVREIVPLPSKPPSARVIGTRGEHR